MSDEKPNCPTINPNCTGVENEALKNFCGASVVADFLFSVFGYESFYKTLPWLTVATIADMVQIDKLNYWRVKTGLDYLRSDRTCVSFASLCTVLKIDQSKLTVDDIGFLIGPTINSFGRLKDMTLGVQAILETDYVTAVDKWKLGVKTNKERKEKTKEGLDLAEKDMNIIINDNVIVVQADIHEGVLGIVASQLKEKYKKPSIVFNMDGKASCRSIPNFHIRDALVQCDKYLLKFGGHAAAAGLTMSQSNIEKFAEKMNSLAVGVNYIPDPFIIDCKPKDLPELCNAIVFGVWGQGLQKPLIRVKVRIEQIKYMKDTHTSMILDVDGKTFDAVMFNKLVLSSKQGKKRTIVCEPVLSNFMKSSLQLKVIEL